MDNTAALCINRPFYMLQVSISMVITKTAMCCQALCDAVWFINPLSGPQIPPWVTNTTGLCFNKPFSEKTTPSDG